MSIKPPEEIQFSETLSGLISVVQDISERLSELGIETINADLLKLAAALVHAYDNKHELVQSVIEYSYEYWGKIKHKERNFFIENAGDIFSHLPSGHVQAFKKIFELKDEHGKYMVTEMEEEDLWAFFEALVRVSIRYVHRQRQPCLTRTRAGITMEYKNPDFMSYIDLERNAKEWDLELSFE